MRFGLLTCTLVAFTLSVPTAALAVDAGYDKGFFIRADKKPYELKIGGRMQVRYTYEGLTGKDDVSSFSVPRARLVLQGKVFHPGLTFKFQTDFGKGFASLKDFYADFAAVKGWLHIRAGQWKRPFSRQQLTSSGKLALADRAITDKAFGAGRDIGFMLHNDTKSSLEWAIGLFNGQGDAAKLTGTKFTNVPTQFNPSLVARIGFNHGGIDGYSEGDIEGATKHLGFRFALGASAQVDFDSDEDHASSVKGELDYILKVHGFSSTGGVYVASKQDGVDFKDQTYASLGFHIQASYVIGKWVMPTLEYANVLPDGKDNDEQTIALGLTVFGWGHNLKWTTDGTVILAEKPGKDHTDWMLRTQLQLGF